MKKLLTKTLKGLAYIAFFGLCFILFLYASAPLDQVKDLLKRTASTTYDYDLEIGELSLPGLAAVRLDGVVVTRRPSTDEMEQMKTSRDALKAWRERQKAKKTGPVDESASSGPKSTDTKGKKTDTKKPIDKNLVPAIDPTAAPETSTAAKKSATPTVATTDKSAEKPSDDPKPKLVKGPMPVSVDFLEVRLSPEAIISDLLDGQLFNDTYHVEVEGELVGGRLSATAQRGAEDIDLELKTEGVDLNQLHDLAAPASFPVNGAINLDSKLSIPLNDKGKLVMSKLNGNVELDVQNIVVGPGQFDSPKLRGFGPIDVPKVRVSKLGGTVEFAKKRGRFKKFVIEGPDLSGLVDGYVKLTSRLKDVSADLYLSLAMSEKFKEKNKSLASAQRTIPILKRATTSDGALGFTAKGKFSKLRWSPRKTNPHARRSTRRSAKSKSAKGPRGRKKAKRTKPSKIKSKGKTQRSKGIKKVNSQTSRPKYKPSSSSKYPPAPSYKANRPSKRTKGPGYPKSQSADSDDGDEEEEDEDDDETSDADEAGDEKPDEPDEADEGDSNDKATEGNEEDD